MQSWSEYFEKLIKSPEGRAHFQQFLKLEFSEENMLFWLACEELKKETNRTTVEETVKRIYEDYVSVLSPKEVYTCSYCNISQERIVSKRVHVFVGESGLAGS